MKILTENTLFKGLTESQITDILSTAYHREKSFLDGEIIVHQGIAVILPVNDADGRQSAGAETSCRVE